MTLNSHRGIRWEAGEKGLRIGYGEVEEMGHVSTEYGTIGSQPVMDGCVCAVIVSVLYRRTKETVVTPQGCQYSVK